MTLGAQQSQRSGVLRERAWRPCRSDCSAAPAPLPLHLSLKVQTSAQTSPQKFSCTGAGVQAPCEAWGSQSCSCCPGVRPHRPLQARQQPGPEPLTRQLPSRDRGKQATSCHKSATRPSGFEADVQALSRERALGQRWSAGGQTPPIPAAGHGNFCLVATLKASSKESSEITSI